MMIEKGIIVFFFSSVSVPRFNFHCNMKGPSALLGTLGGCCNAPPEGATCHNVDTVTSLLCPIESARFFIRTIFVLVAEVHLPCVRPLLICSDGVERDDRKGWDARCNCRVLMLESPCCDLVLWSILQYTIIAPAVDRRNERINAPAYTYSTAKLRCHPLRT